MKRALLAGSLFVLAGAASAAEFGTAAEAKAMLERISKAELAYSLQHGSCAEFQVLITEGLLPDDVLTSTSTGYNYAVQLTSDKRRYFATATPAVYGKTGKRSFLLELDSKGISRVTSKDNGGQPMKK